MRLSALAAVAVVVSAGWVASPAGAQTLTDEDFWAFGPAVTAECEPGGQTIRYTAEGVATGPYPGTFVEEGTVTLGEYDPFWGIAPVTGLKARFTIESVNGTVRGKKWAADRPPPPALGGTGSSFGECTEEQIIFNVADVAYRASIKGPAGHGKDEGCVGQVFAHVERATPSENLFHQGLFVSDPQQTSCSP